MEKITKAEFGKLGEEFCSKYYIKNGFSLTEMNYHSRYGEIDVIVENENTLVFVEVKTRVEKSIVEARDAVIKSKQKKIMLTALDYLSRHPSDKNIRFDVFEVLHNGEKLTQYRLNESAFEFDENLIKDVFY